MNTLMLFMVLVPVIILVLLLLNLFLSTHNPNSEKLSPYECGFVAIGDTRAKFSVEFYLVGILFLVFDLELLFLYPLAVSLYQISTYGFFIALIFLILLTIGFIYEFGKGALKFSKKS